MGRLGSSTCLPLTPEVAVLVLTSAPSCSRGGKTQAKLGFHLHPCKPGIILPKSVDIFSIYNSVPKSKIWQSFQLSIYKLFLAANKAGGGEDYSLQMLCKINRGFLVTIKSTNIVTFGRCFLKCDLREFSVIL